MEFLAEIVQVILGRFIIRFLGVNTRYYFLKIFDESLTKEDLLGDSDDLGSQFGHDIINVMVGFCALFCIFYLVGFVFFR